MLLNRNLLESLTIFSCSGTIICILLNYLTNISPITGIWFGLYILTLFFISITFSFKFIQLLLHLNKPLKYDLQALSENYGYLRGFIKFLPRVPERDSKEIKEYDTNELSVISTVLERKLVSSWYVPYVSQEIGFPFACKQLLDQMIGRTFQICNKIETKDVFVDICSVLITHLKEYGKAIKRREKSPSSTIEYLYKKSHSVSMPEKKLSSAEHCTNLLRIILKDLVPWELWDTPYTELLIRILSKKLDNFIDNTLSNPIWLNDALLTILNGEKEVKDKEAANEMKLQDDINTELIKSQEATKTFTDDLAGDNESTNNDQEVIKDFPENKEGIQSYQEVTDGQTTKESKLEATTIESALSTLITQSIAPILPRPINDGLAIIDDEIESSEGIDIKCSPILRQRRGRQGRNEVKIYDRVIEGSVKTWETDVDLQCISLGQDLLASLNGEITLSRLWGQESEPDAGRDQNLWFGEEDIEIDPHDSPQQSPKELSPTNKESPKERSPTKRDSPKERSPTVKDSPKAKDVLLKDLQTTVHQAKTKIGDLQVPIVDVKNDEAAGMMEGLLDFGIAGFKKGLRFTGFSDDSQDKSMFHHKERDRHSPQETSKGKTEEGREVFASSLIQKEDNITAVPTLVKQQRVASQDSVASQPKPILCDMPPPLVPVSDSPEPEYEEAADLSTSIAKLRCLLQQRADLSPNRNEDIWWESAEETRGRTQRHHSSRPVDTATLADEYDMNADKNTSPGQTSNNMQRLDKLFHRTVTGVFNSIKTAVGAEGEGGAPITLQPWTYVCTSVELSVGGAVARLVGSRRALQHVDTALDSLDQLAPPPKEKEIVPEDFDEWCSSCGRGWCACAQLAVSAGLIDSHVAYRIATLLCADIAESLITIWLDELTAWLRKQVFKTFENLAEDAPGSPRQLRDLDLDETCRAVMEKLPGLRVFGEDTVQKTVKLTASSFTHKEINKDVTFRILDIITLYFKNSAALRNPSFDNN